MSAMRVVDGKRYDVTQSTRVCKLSCKYYSGDFGWHDTNLYATAKGAFFLAGEGGPMSRWGKPATGGGMIEGRGLEPISRDEARRILESENEFEALDEYFSDEIEDA